jgi:hypothetical protein
MCLDITNSRERLIAETDITCYKVLQVTKKFLGFIKKYKTPFYHAKIEIGKTYYSDFEYNIYSMKSLMTYVIEKGLHTFTTHKGAISQIAELKLNKITHRRFCVVECTIPKGTEYYIGEFGNGLTYSLPSYASSELKYNKIIK